MQSDRQQEEQADITSEIGKLLNPEKPQVVVLVGAGVSIGATNAPQASWRGLLEDGFRYLEKIKKFTPEYKNELIKDIDQAFNNPFDLNRVLELAENIENNLKLLPSEFSQWLTTAFQDLKALENKQGTLKALHDFQQEGALLMTTNYDNLLTDITGSPPVTWEEHDTFLQVINKKKKGILHIHGHWRNPSSVVFGRQSYDRCRSI